MAKCAPGSGKLLGGAFWSSSGIRGAIGGVGAGPYGSVWRAGRTAAQPTGGADAWGTVAARRAGRGVATTRGRDVQRDVRSGRALCGMLGTDVRNAADMAR